MRCIRAVYAVCVPRYLTNNISFRLPASEMGTIQALRATFPDQQWGVAMRWLFEQPEVKDLISNRAKASGQVKQGPVGIENSLPTGDR